MYKIILIISIFFLFTSSLLAQNLSISTIQFMGVTEDDNGNTTYQLITTYDPSEEIPAEFVDIIVSIKNNSDTTRTSIPVQLMVTPKSARLIWSKEDPESLNEEATRKNGSWLAPYVFQTKTIEKLEPHQTIQLKFEHYPLKVFMETYHDKAGKKSAITDFKFTATLPPLSKEKEISFSKILPIDLGE